MKRYDGSRPGNRRRLLQQIADVGHLIAFGLVLLIAGVMDQLPDTEPAGERSGREAFPTADRGDGYSSAARRRRQRANEPGRTGSQ